MTAGTAEPDFLSRLGAWAEAHDGVRAVLLTSTRASPAGPVDALSDYDVVLYVADPERFRDFDAWLPGLGPVLLRTPLEARRRRGRQYRRGVFFEDLTKADVTVSPAAVLPELAAEDRLPPGLDLGYRALVDKDGLAAGLPPPTYTAYLPQPPTAEDYRALVEEFWWGTTYVAKYLWRDEPFAARAVLDGEVRGHGLRTVLEWVVGVEHGWAVRPGVLGRQLKRHLPPAVWAEVERTFGGADAAGHWRALFRTVAVFRRCARLVAARLRLPERPGHPDDALLARDPSVAEARLRAPRSAGRPQDVPTNQASASGERRCAQVPEGQTVLRRACRRRERRRVLARAGGAGAAPVLSRRGQAPGAGRVRCAPGGPAPSRAGRARGGTWPRAAGRRLPRRAAPAAPRR